MVGTMTISVIDRKLGTFITVHTELSQSSDEGVKLSHVDSSAMLGAYRDRGQFKPRWHLVSLNQDEVGNTFGAQKRILRVRWPS